MLSHMQWLRINEIIQNLYLIKEESEMLNVFLDSLRILVPYDKAIFYQKRNNNYYEILRDLDKTSFNKYTKILETSNKGVIASNNRRSIAYRDSDYLEERLIDNEIYQEILLPQGISYGCGIILVSNLCLVGELSLYRKKDDFTNNEIEILNIIKDHLEIRLDFKNESNKRVANYLNECGLTKREIEIVKLLQEDYNNEKLAAKLNISIHTIKKHNQNIFTKLDIKNRMQLIQLISSIK